MKKQLSKISLRKVIVSKMNTRTMYNIKGGSSIPTDSVNGDKEDLGDTDDPNLTYGNCDSSPF
ncbi:class I lanthipeptide [Kordia sp.]|uniref:class I lanthipeptide n=1 Tax=Kordia sp. TaxID=1965332 RepID=UPI003B5C92CC